MKAPSLVQLRQKIRTDVHRFVRNTNDVDAVLTDHVENDMTTLRTTSVARMDVTSIEICERSWGEPYGNCYARDFARSITALISKPSIKSFLAA